ncbi:MAG: serine hydrolase domain-containing protein [Caulobacteraceae bacterium]
MARKPTTGKSAGRKSAKSGGLEAKTVKQRFDELFSPWNRTDAPGLVVGVAKEGALLYRRGFGMASLETNLANSPRTRMRIGSTSKHFTALLGLLLAEDGKFDLDQPIRDYLPELTGPGGDPSSRLLLQHRGGSRCYLDLAMTCRGLASPPRGDALRAQIRQKGRNFAPGEAMIYNNGGYHLLSIALERVGGAPFEDQLKARLFDKVGMPDTASVPSDRLITPGVATFHVPGPGGAWYRGLFPSDEVRGEGAIISTIDDMLRWMAHLKRRDLFGSKKTWAELVERPVYADGAKGSYALGLMHQTYRGVEMLHHAGGVFGGTSQMLMVPGYGLDVIIMANGAPAANVVRLAEQVVDVVLEDGLAEVSAPIAAKDHKKLLGAWASEKTGMILNFLDEGGALKLGFAGMPQGLPLERRGEKHLAVPAGGIGEIEITLDCEDRLETVFGSEKARYRKVSPLGSKGTLAKAFAKAAQGRYRSEDGDCTATISGEDEGLSIRFADPFGQVGAKLVPMGEALAATSPASPFSVHYAALSFEKLGRRMSGFRLNTVRTRDLAFERVE